MKKLVLFLAIGASVFVGYMGFVSRDYIIPIVLILGFTFIFGYLLPSIAWRLALLVGIGVPLVIFAAYYLGYEPAIVEEARKHIPSFDYDVSDALKSFLAMVPSFLGAYGGVVVKKILKALLTKKSPIEP